MHCFGTRGAVPKASIRAALHADEVPALLVAHHLRPLLQTAEAEGRLRGEVLLVPAANPPGLGQQLLVQHHGRFQLADGVNFNRYLHCDSVAVMHLYALTPQADIAAELGALLGAQAVLLATESGDSPFDETCSATWLKLARRLAPRPLPLGCFAVTVELRGQADTGHAQSAADAAPVPLPAARCQPTPLAGSEPLEAPHAGVVVCHRAPGDRVKAGGHVAGVVCPLGGRTTPFARARRACCTRAWPRAGPRRARGWPKWPAPRPRAAAGCSAPESPAADAGCHGYVAGRS